MKAASQLKAVNHCLLMGLIAQELTLRFCTPGDVGGGWEPVLLERGCPDLGAREKWLGRAGVGAGTEGLLREGMTASGKTKEKESKRDHLLLPHPGSPGNGKANADLRYTFFFFLILFYF